MLSDSNPVEELAGVDARALSDRLMHATQPLVLRGLIADWPLVRAGQASPDAAAAYLLDFYCGADVAVMVGPPEQGGRYFFNADLTGFNFRTERAKLDSVLTALLRHVHDDRPPGIYVGSTTIDACLPGFRAANDLGFGDRKPLSSVWIGNRSRVSAHQDVPDNIACVAAGRRRFTLFPPDQLANLYIGPLDFSPAGQAISLVDFTRPDLEKYPRFAEAVKQSRVAELGPGDAIFIPSLWWHHIEALDPFNILVNYWWREAPTHVESPLNALMLALISIRDLRPEQRASWQEIFRHYIFEPDENTAAHIPQHARGVLAPLDAASVASLRTALLKRLER